MNDQYKCTGTGVRIRKGPSTSSEQVGTLYNGEIVTVTEVSGNWYKHSRGYTSASYLQLVSRGSDTTTNTSQAVENVTQQVNSESYSQREEVDLSELSEDVTDEYPDEESTLFDMIYTDSEYLNNLSNNTPINTLRGIHGMPYQFSSIVDNRINKKDESIGRKYAEKIVARMPLLILIPGKPKFMAGYSAAAKKNVLTQYILKSGGHESDIDNAVDENGRYYSFETDYANYFDYFNSAMRVIAEYMDIADEKVNGIKLKNFDWCNDIDSDLSNIIRYSKCLAYYIDTDKQISESFGNDTAQSSIASSINSLSDYAREAQFLLGTTAYATNTQALGDAYDKFVSQDNLETNIQNVNSFIDKIIPGNGGNIFSKITSNIQTLVSGGKLIFPEIWSDSSNGGKSFDISLKLVCPDPTPLGLYLDIMAPIMSLVCATAPRAATANGYISPFLVRAFYKGMFNVDMGIITNLSISKGGEGSWSREGIPTVAEVNFTIKDLYSQFAISKSESGVNSILNNLAYMDFLANMCGINVNEPDISRQISLYLASNGITRVRDALRYDIFRGLEQWWTNTTNSIWTNLIR